MAHNKKIIYAFLVTLAFQAIGTIGYAILEDFTPLDAFYMTVITISTVGFGEIHTLSEAGRIFTIFLIIFGFGSIGFLAHAFTEAIVERASSQNLRKKAMHKRIDQLSKHCIICGYGRVGEAAAEHFHKVGEDFIVIENDEEQLKIIEEHGYSYIEGDATREQILLSAGIKKADALLALLDADPDNLFTVLTARELNPTLHIIARTEVASSESRMLRAGADSIISPHVSAGRRVADKILASTKKELIEESVDIHHTGETRWIEVTEQSDLEGHVVETANSFLRGTITGIRRDGLDSLMPHADEKILLGDELLVSPSAISETQHKPLRQRGQKIVLIDDNPVIRHLYTRLFQKAGYHIITAATGKEGYEVLLSEKPVAAIIDFELPDINGLEISRQIRQNPILHDMKIFLFTTRYDADTQENAKKAGVDTVVIKSPDAAEIVTTVENHLERT